MKKYEFTLVLEGTAELSEELSDALYDAGCDDASLGSCGGLLSLDFHRESSSLEEAIRSAIANVRSAGLEVASVVVEPSSLAHTA